MSIRLHLSLSFVAIAAGFAAAGAIAGWYLLVDYHGYLLLRCLVQGTGAVLLAGLGWIVSWRLALAADLRTAPWLRVGIAGAPAIWVSTQVVGVYTELAFGTGDRVVYPLATLLYAAVGAPVLLAGVVGLAAAESVYLALRSRRRIADALRPLRPSLLAGVLCGAVIVIGAVWLRVQVEGVMVALAPDRPRASAWLEREKRLFTAVLAGAGCEILVAPLSAASPSIDRPGRSLIARYLAEELMRRSDRCVFDPTLAARALGASARRYDWPELRTIAERAGARVVVHGKVEVARGSASFVLRLDVYARDPSGAWVSAGQVEWGPVHFSDERPAEAVTLASLSDLVEGLGLPLKPREVEPSRPGSLELPSSPEGLVRDPGSAVDRAARLQVLASIYATEDVAGEHLWERSLVALMWELDDNEQARTLRALAALNLHRRPYALALLQGLTSPAARTVQGLAQGNLDQARDAAEEISEPAMALIAKLQVERMRARYGRTLGFEGRREELLSAYPEYTALLLLPLSSGDWFQPGVHELVRRELVRQGVQVDEGLLIALLRGAASLAGEQLYFADLSRLPVAVERAYAPLWRKKGRDWRSERASDRIAFWDVPEAYFSANRAAVAASAVAIEQFQGRHQAALRFARDLGPSFGGFPQWHPTLLRAMYYQRGRESGSTPLGQVREQRLVKDLMAWDPIESEIRGRVNWYADWLVPGSVADEPPRSWRAAPRWTPGPAGTSNAQVRAAAHYSRMLAFARYDFEPLREAHEQYVKLGLLDEAQRVAGEARHRFQGNPAREQFLIKLARDRDDLPAYIALLQEKVRADPDDWGPYEQLAEAQLAVRDPEGALQTVRSYPHWESAHANAVALSNYAWDGARLFIRSGEGRISRPLLELSAGYETGSAAEMWSRFHLARMDRDWTRARNWALRMHDRYREETALSRAAALSFLLGDTEEGWRAFSKDAEQSGQASVWGPAILGHRLAQTPPDEIVAFALRWRSSSIEPARQRWLRLHFGFNLLLVDRLPDDKAVERLASLLEGERNEGFLELARGYVAFKRGRYDAMLERLGPLHQSVIRESRSRTEHLNLLTLPYVVLGLIEAGRRDEAQALLVSHRQLLGRDFYYLLGRAMLDGRFGQTQAALDSLWNALLQSPRDGDIVMPSDYQLLEAHETLYALTGDSRYLAQLGDLAARITSVRTDSWAYAMQALYAQDQATREQALGMAVHLDPQSAHLQGLPADQRKRAAERFAQHNPYARR